MAEESFLWPPDDGYDRDRTAYHEAGHVVARYAVYGTTGSPKTEKPAQIGGFRC